MTGVKKAGEGVFPYTDPAEVLEQARARLRDPDLQARVAEYLGGVWPQGFEEPTEPIAVYAPYLAMGTEEECVFLGLARKLGIKRTVTATYEAKPYSTSNYYVYRPQVLLPDGQKQGATWVVPSGYRNAANKTALGSARTIYPGLGIVEYWRGVRQAVLANKSLGADNQVVDFSDWYKLQAERLGCGPKERPAPFYYQALMALYASGRAVLFDTPPTEFVENIMQPAYDTVVDALGVTPLLTNVLPLVEGPDWVDLRFMTKRQRRLFLNKGQIPMTDGEGATNE